jgi:hypothetical protein
MIETETQKKIIELRKLDVSIRDIADIVSIPKSTIHDFLTQIPPNNLDVLNVYDDNNKRILIISDLHCGHKAGLTPPEFWVNEHDAATNRLERECWEFYSNTLKQIGDVDVVVLNGDAIDGKGKRSGGSELLTTDLFIQSKIVRRCVEEINFNKFFMTYGTPYHVSSDGDDFEISIAEYFGGVIKDHLWLDVNGCVIDFKHKISGSSVLSSRVSALIKEYQWNREWSKINGAPEADVFIRSHVHYHMSVKDPNTFFGATTPALQAPDTKYGGRQCSGTVHFVMMLLEVPCNYHNVDDITIKIYKKQLTSTKSKSIII